MKKSLSVIATITLSLSLVLGTANAEENSVETKVDELHEQLSKIDENASLSVESKENKVEETISQAPIEVQEAFAKNVGDTIDRFLKSEGLTISGSGKSETVDLGNGTSITFGSEEEIESLEDPSAGRDVVEIDGVTTSGYKFTPENRVTKKYGNRSYTATVTMTSYGVNIGTLKLANKYTISSKGLTMRYVSKSGTRGLEPIFQLKTATATATDTKAEKVGYDMNGLGEYSYFVGIKGVGVTYHSEIRSTIQLTRWNADDKKKKQARVYEGYSWVH